MLKRQVALVSLLFFSLLLISIKTGYATDVSIQDLPVQVGQALGLPEDLQSIVGGLFLSCLMFVTLVLPCMLLKNKAPAGILSIMLICFFIILGWIPFFVLLLVIFLLAGFFGRQIIGWFK